MQDDRALRVLMAWHDHAYPHAEPFARDYYQYAAREILKDLYACGVELDPPDE